MTKEFESEESSGSIFGYLQGQVPAINKLTIRNTEIDTPHGSPVHAIDGNGSATLLVPVGGGSKNALDWQNKAITFGYRVLNEETFLALQCIAPRLLPQFSMMVDDVLDSVRKRPEDADLATRQTVERWREMLRDHKGPLLSSSQLAGLYGELTFLEQVAHGYASTALSAWTGPQGNRHDFEFFNAAVEVKATTNHNNMVVSFHGSRQLEKTEQSPLYVVAYQIENTPTGQSISALLQRLYDAGVSRLDLLSRLQCVGYFEGDSEHYGEHRFQVLSTKVFEVEDDFPRITHDTLVDPLMLDMISGLQYSVDLGHLTAVDVRFEDLVPVGVHP
jgi:hypothetical protein